MRFDVWHQTAYGYDKPVTNSLGVAYLLPRTCSRQQVETAAVTLTPDAGDLVERIDSYGNRALNYQVDVPHTKLVIEARSAVETSTPALDESLLAQPWESLRPLEDGVSHPGSWVATEFALPSPLIDHDAAQAYGAHSLPAGRPIGEAVMDLVHRVYEDHEYDPTATTVTSTVADTITKKAGVCQDFAHLAIASLRSHGLAARYVSGYIATTPPPGKEKVFGADASHAWLSVWLGGPGGEGVWFDVDPTNDQSVGERYVTVAWGRDYGDVPPVKGVIFTEATKSTLKVRVDVSEPAATPPTGVGAEQPGT